MNKFNQLKEKNNIFMENRSNREIPRSADWTLIGSESESGKSSPTDSMNQLLYDTTICRQTIYYDSIQLNIYFYYYHQ